MKLGYSTNAYMKTTIHDAIRRVAALGYEGVELMADVPHAWPETTDQREIEAIRETIHQSNISICNINAFMMNAVGDPRHPYWHPSWIESDLEKRRVRIEHTRRSLTLARQLGADCISTEPGGPLEEGTSYEQGMSRFVEGLKPVLEHAEAEGVTLLVEPEPGLLIETTEQFLDLASRIESPALKLNFDVGHFYCVSEPLGPAIERLAEHIHHVHVEDIAATRVHQHLIPGRGAIDFAEVFSALKKIDYQGWCTVELYPYIEDPDGAGREARTHLLDFLSDG